MWWLLITYLDTEEGRKEEDTQVFSSMEEARTEMRSKWNAQIRKLDSEFGIVDVDSCCGQDSAFVCREDGSVLNYEIAETYELPKPKKKR